MNEQLSPVYRNLLLFYSKARSANFGAQYWVLNKLSSLLGFKTPQRFYEPEFVEQIQTEFNRLLENDVRRIQEGIYPASVLKPVPALSQLRRAPKILYDLIWVGSRRTKGRAKDFSPAAKQYLNDLPEYYRRNFHFQSDGYLSERSAEAYEYEVEMLFSGTADAMRRLIIEPMKNHFRDHPEGQGLRFLELGTGTGRATMFVKQAFPKAKIVAIDLSEPYLRVAHQRLSQYSNLSFLQADAASLPFKKGSYDAVFSIFLFHELPLEVRRRVIEESHRVLKRGGFIGFVDSIQSGDQSAFDPYLGEFPKNFHEPYYRNYIQTPMEELFKAAKTREFRTEVGLFSKVGYGKKPKLKRKNYRPVKMRQQSA